MTLKALHADNIQSNFLEDKGNCFYIENKGKNNEFGYLIMGGTSLGLFIFTRLYFLNQ